MTTASKIFALLENKGLTLKNKVISEYFGNYTYEYTNGIFNVKINSYKSSESIDISYANEPDEWYDLSLIKALLFSEQDLTIPWGIEACYDFLKQNYDNIENMLYPNNFEKTSKSLKKLKNIRMHQMFPGIHE